MSPFAYEPTSKHRLVFHMAQEHGLILIVSKANAQWLHGVARAEKDCGWHA